jgi:excinuclease ABC subunit C
LHAAADALLSIGIAEQPLASIAKREAIIYVYGQEDEPVVLDRFSPILHLVQSIRDEAHRFAVTFHRSLRNTRQLTSELDAIRGVGAKTVLKLLKEFGSLERVRAATETQLAVVVGRAAAKRVVAHDAAPVTVSAGPQSENGDPDVPEPPA